MESAYRRQVEEIGYAPRDSRERLRSALAEAGDEFSVFVFDPGTSTLEKRAVRTGGVRDNDVAVLEGLNEGDIIATAGVPFLRDGQEVRLLDEQLIRSAR